MHSRRVLAEILSQMVRVLWGQSDTAIKAIISGNTASIDLQVADFDLVLGTLYGRPSLLDLILEFRGKNKL